MDSDEKDTNPILTKQMYVFDRQEETLATLCQVLTTLKNIEVLIQKQIEESKDDKSS